MKAISSLLLLFPFLNLTGPSPSVQPTVLFLFFSIGPSEKKIKKLERKKALKKTSNAAAFNKAFNNELQSH